MSVIFGMHEADRITIVADKREYNFNTNELNDNSQKLFVIHEQLCIAIRFIAYTVDFIKMEKQC